MVAQNQYDSLALEDVRRIESICTQFERQAALGPAAIKVLLREFSGPAREVLLQELVALDVEMRTARGETVNEYDYASLLQSVDDAARDVIEQFFQTEADAPVSDRYRFECEVGRGGIGSVWRVYDRVSERPLAVKVLHEKYRDLPMADRRLLNEALLTGQLQHPGIPPVFDRGHLPDGLAFFAMKLIEGETLEKTLQSREDSEDDFLPCIGILKQVAQTLAYAHEQSVIHRDLKPQNIMVGRFGEVQVMDWGMAKPLGGNDVDGLAVPESELATQPNYADAQSTIPYGAQPIGDDSGNLTLAGDVIGTPSYMAPEQARGETASLDARTDVFGLGVILFQMLTNRRLYSSDSPADILAQSARGDLREAFMQLECVDGRQALVDLCRRCLSPDPYGRPSNASEVANAINEYLDAVEAKLQQAEIDRQRAEVERIEVLKRQRVFNRMATTVVSITLLGALAIAWQWSVASQLAIAEAQAREKAESEAATVNEVNDYLGLLLSSARPEQFGADVTVAEVIDAMLPELEGKFADKPRVEGDIRLTIGKTYRSLGYDNDSIEQLREAVACFRRIQPRNEQLELTAKDELAGMLRSRGLDESDLREAAELRNEVLKRRIELLGEAHPLTVKAMNGLGLVYEELGELDKAEELISRAMDLLKYDPQAKLEDYMAFKNNLMLIHWDKNDYATAEAGMRELLELYEGNAHGIESLNIMNNLASILADQDKVAEAEQLYREAIAGRSEFYGALHPLTLSSSRKLSRLLVNSGDYDRALPLLRGLTENHVDVYGADAGVTFGVRQYLAFALQQLGRSAEAQQCLEETIEVLDAGRGTAHEYTQIAREQLDEFLAGSQISIW